MNGVSDSEAFYARYGKRSLDLLVSVLAVLILSPIMAILAALVYMNLSSPVFFRQQRPGQGNRTITVLKFRTMSDARDLDGRLLPVQRLTSFGRFLRRSSLEELPQLFNVIRGDMSLVGRVLFLRNTYRITQSGKMRDIPYSPVLRARPRSAGATTLPGMNVLRWMCIMWSTGAYFWICISFLRR